MVAAVRGFLYVTARRSLSNLATQSSMPKLLVLFDPRSDDLTRLAEAVAEGARRVRFAEVDLRAISGTAGDAGGAAGTQRHRALEGADALAAYDGIIVGATQGEAAGGGAVQSLSEMAGKLVNKVGSAFASDHPNEDRRGLLWSTLIPMADWGMILVPPADHGMALASPAHAGSPTDELEPARALGNRVAEVVGWVTHARSHHHHH